MRHYLLIAGAAVALSLGAATASQAAPMVGGSPAQVHGNTNVEKAFFFWDWGRHNRRWHHRRWHRGW